MRHSALMALGELGTSSNIGAMIDGYLMTSDAGRKEKVERAIMFVCNKEKDANRRAVAILAKVGSDNKMLIAMLPTLGRVGGQPAIDAVKKAMVSSDSSLKDAGIRALCNWPDTAVADDMFRLAKEAKEDKHKIAALRGFMRVVSLPEEKSKLSDGARLARLKAGFAIATRKEEKLLAIDRAKAIRTMSALMFVAPYLDDADGDLVQQACSTVINLAHYRDLREPNRKEFEPILKKAIEKVRDNKLKDRGQRYLAGSV